MARIYVSKVEAEIGVEAYYDFMIAHLIDRLPDDEDQWSSEERKRLKACYKMMQKMKRAVEATT